MVGSAAKHFYEWLCQMTLYVSEDAFKTQWNISDRVFR